MATPTDKKMATAAVPGAADLANLLEFLTAKEVAHLIASHRRAVNDDMAVWSYICTRLQPFHELPRDPPKEFLHPVVFLLLLRRLHAMSTFDFPVRFDASRRGTGVRFADSEGLITNWTPQGASVLGDRCCVPDGVSYWEATGLSDGSYVGVAEDLDFASRNGFSYGAAFRKTDVLLSMKTPACDNMSAIMYCESGFITNGYFRGPKLRLPSNVRFLQAEPFTESDRVGVCVDLLEGRLLFFLNGKRASLSIPIDRKKKYAPVFSARGCYDLQLLPNARPAWDQVYHLHNDIAMAVASVAPTVAPWSDNDELEDDVCMAQAVVP
ncbi:TPA: hypothetical protein N0F65_012320 [Lagenidium giganteum]|uniref:B30.2/SPRY domain-containing protein n=1 Tax=Lagenidium giganteum TaxID=4803 RepID=A0AAV2YTW9_9STRA|nr:TPA: hypothetical protein N0F65_012320 [Lagenidium giganteum]